MLETDLTKVIELLSVHGIYVVLIMALVDSEQFKKLVTVVTNVWHTISSKFIDFFK